MGDLSPPWILFVDNGKPVAILPAGRTGEVANVSHLTMKEAKAIVAKANLAAIGRSIADLKSTIELRPRPPTPRGGGR